MKRIRIRRTRLIAMLLALSLLVSLDVFWTLRRPGLTLAGNADCKITEHTHDESCQEGANCRYQEHTHTIECYADKTADVETQLDWQNLFKDSNGNQLDAETRGTIKALAAQGYDMDQIKQYKKEFGHSDIQDWIDSIISEPVRW